MGIRRPAAALDALVAVPGVDLLGDRVQARIVVGIGNLRGHKSLITQLASGVCDVSSQLAERRDFDQTRRTRSAARSIGSAAQDPA